MEDAKIIKEEKLTEDQLKQVKELNGKFLATKVQIADAEINKNKSLKDLEVIQVEFADLEKQLIEEYGDNAVIDVATGNVTHPEKEENNGENK
jgi:predicted house-cleaning NTP pyrophosphatase (Maf/HAM1 superfamily)|tara:strand:- start:206 stop:484 length:279 start_codon:yes stop_codon:yes gene_type:complete